MGFDMAGKSKNAGRRLLVLKHDRWWFRRAVPVSCRKALGLGGFYLVNLGTSDLKVAQGRRDDLEAETAALFGDAKAGKLTAEAVASARSRGVLAREAIIAAKEDDYAEPGEFNPLDVAITSAETTAEGFQEDADRAAFLDALHGREEVTAHLEAHLAALRKNGIVEKSVKEREGLIKSFAAWAAVQKPALTLDRIDRRKAGQYVSEELDALHPKTLSKHLMALRGYWVHLAARGVVNLPPQEQRLSGWPWNAQQIRAKATRAERGSRNDRERPFSEEEVKTLLFSVFPEAMAKEHEDQIRDAFRISLLSGMRMAEVLRLWVDDVKEAGDGAGLVFDIQEGKTDAAARPVPVHPDLLETVHRRLKDPKGANKQPGAWLFHELEGERDAADTFGKRFRRYRLALGVDDKREGKRRSLINFHSARRWFATAAERAGQREAIIKDVLGHEPDEKNVTRRYIARSSGAQMRACVESVKLPSR